MRHPTALLALSLAAALLVQAPDAAAQANVRAYAPEDLSALPQRDQIRVIRNEYADQSGGRTLPEDQLRFYLDQVSRSDWGFSDIKRDIATSLGGQQRPPAYPGTPVAPGQTVSCASSHYRYRECRTGFRGEATLMQTTSKTRCIEGQNWGSRPGTVWVNQGCSGRFAAAGHAAVAPAYRVQCSSDRYGSTHWCAWQPGRGIPAVAEDHSGRRCVEGRSWGHVPARGIWVADGCSATFTPLR